MAFSVRKINRLNKAHKKSCINSSTPISRPPFSAVFHLWFDFCDSDDFPPFFFGHTQITSINNLSKDTRHKKSDIPNWMSSIIWNSVKYLEFGERKWPVKIWEKYTNCWHIEWSLWLLIQLPTDIITQLFQRFFVCWFKIFN